MDRFERHVLPAGRALLLRLDCCPDAWITEDMPAWAATTSDTSSATTARLHLPLPPALSRQNVRNSPQVRHAPTQPAMQLPSCCSSMWPASSLQSAASCLHLPITMEATDTAADAYPQGPHAIAFMGSRQMGHCGSGAPAGGCSGAPCCTRAGKLPFCFCFWGCSTSSSASSGECEVRSITASVCCWKVCAVLNVCHQCRQAAGIRNMLCAEELTQARRCCICSTAPEHMKGGKTGIKPHTCRRLLACRTALMLDALLRPACLSCLSCCGLRSCGCRLACQGDHICTQEACQQNVDTHCSVFLLRSAASSWVPGAALRMSESMAQPENGSMAQLWDFVLQCEARRTKC